MTQPTPAQIATLAAYVRTGSQKGAANERGVRPQTVKNHMTDLYQRLGVSGFMQAVVALGWVSVPGDPPKACGWVGYCSRPAGHRGHHGGFRSVDK